MIGPWEKRNAFLGSLYFPFFNFQKQMNIVDRSTPERLDQEGRALDEAKQMEMAK